MKKRDNLFLWKAQLLDKIFKFAVVFGFITLLVSGTITMINGLYLQTSLYILVYFIAVFTAFKKNLSFRFRVNTLIFITNLLSLIILFLEGDMTIGMIWLVYSIFFAVTFLPRKQYIKVISFSALIILTWFLNYIYAWYIPIRHITELFYYVKFANSTLFLIAGILYINENLIKNIAESLHSERVARKELKIEKKNIEKTNVLLEIKFTEIDGLKSQLELANSALSSKVVEQEIGIQETMEDLKEEIENHKETESELIKAREELILSLDKEKALNEMKSKFISMISHEYRTPLTVLMNSTYLLNKYFELNEKQKFDDSINKINHSVVSMTDLLEEVIRFGHSDIDERDNDMLEIDIVDQVNSVITNFENQEKKQFNITVDTTENPLLIRTDARKVRLILNNFIKNALLYSEGSPEVTITLEKVNTDLQISVKDKGIGITENDMDKIFEPFYRGENTIGKNGTGLGLPISKRYAESLSGQIFFESQTGKGSNFTLILPLHKD